MPLQQSPGRTQASLVWMQNEAPSTHWPLLQSLEQHSVWPVHPLPAVLQAVVSGWQVPPAQLPLQQVLPGPQAWLSATQLAAAQTPLLQLRLQQSVATAQGLPAAPQLAMIEAQVEV